MITKKLITPLQEDMLLQLRSGDRVSITGTIYTARDAAHDRMRVLLQEGRPLPVELRGQIIYYAAPTPTPPDKVIGSIGPTTSIRMDPYVPELLDAGLKGMLGKGRRNHGVREACMRNHAVYMATWGGIAALMAQKVKRCSLVAWEDLGPEAIYALDVEDFPAIVINDCYGGEYFSDLLGYEQ